MFHYKRVAYVNLVKAFHEVNCGEHSMFKTMENVGFDDAEGEFTTVQKLESNNRQEKNENKYNIRQGVTRGCLHFPYNI